MGFSNATNTGMFGIALISSLNVMLAATPVMRKASRLASSGVLRRARRSKLLAVDPHRRAIVSRSPAITTMRRWHAKGDKAAHRRDTALLRVAIRVAGRARPEI